jgi:diguanylate cyclase (GGDEF)-like protein
MRHNALHDALTELPNRALLMERLERCIAHAKRHDDYIYAVLFLDVDNFKVINDSLGHRVGDQLLHGIAKRLPSTLRLLDSTTRPTDDTMARFGGDEFVVLLDGIHAAQGATIVAQRITHVLSEPYELSGKQVKVTVSVGIAIGNSAYDEPEDILRDADTALYHVKETTKGSTSVFTQNMRAHAISRMQLECAPHKAITVY